MVNVFPLLADRTVCRMFRTENMFARRSGLLRKFQRATPTLMKTRQPVHHEGLPTSLIKLPVTLQRGNSILFNHISSLNGTQPRNATYKTCIKVTAFLRLIFLSLITLLLSLSLSPLPYLFIFPFFLFTCTDLLPPLRPLPADTEHL